VETGEVYVWKQSILEEAGLAFVVHAEDTLTGNVDGTNKVFVTTYKPIIDSNYDDIVDASDVTLYVNGVPVPVGNVNPVTGAITAQTAPLVGATITADYMYSPIKDQTVCDVRQEAQTHIDEVMSTLEPTPYANMADSPATPATIRRIARWIAAGMLLTRDYGSGSDTDGTSKDGKSKMKTAEEWLSKYLEMGGLTGGSTDPFADADVRAERPLFHGTRRHEYGGQYTPYDNFFMGDDDGLGGSADGDWL
jgi:hypothetical protein